MIRILLFFYLATATLSATHMHHDDNNYTDCKVCPIVKNIDSADIPSAALIIFPPRYHDSAILRTGSIFLNTNLKGFQAQAPPYFS